MRTNYCNICRYFSFFRTNVEVDDTVNDDGDVYSDVVMMMVMAIMMIMIPIAMSIAIVTTVTILTIATTTA